MATVDPYRVKFYDESGFKLPDVAFKKFGHARRAGRCFEIGKHTRSTEHITDVVDRHKGCFVWEHC